MCHFWNTNLGKYRFLVLFVSLYFPVTHFLNISHIPTVWEGVVLNTRVVGRTKACAVSVLPWCGNTWACLRIKEVWTWDVNATLDGRRLRGCKYSQMKSRKPYELQGRKGLYLRTGKRESTVGWRWTGRKEACGPLAGALRALKSRKLVIVPDNWCQTDMYLCANIISIASGPLAKLDGVPN